jgi:hypothetical protein
MGGRKAGSALSFCIDEDVKYVMTKRALLFQVVTNCLGIIVRDSVARLSLTGIATLLLAMTQPVPKGPEAMNLPSFPPHPLL